MGLLTSETFIMSNKNLISDITEAVVKFTTLQGQITQSGYGFSAQG